MKRILKLLMNPAATLKKLIDMLSQSGSPVHYLRKFWIYLFFPANFLSRRSLARSFQADESVISELNTKGYFIPNRPLSGTDEIIALAQTRLDSFLAKNPELDLQKENFKNFTRDVLLPEDRLTSSAFVKFALQEEIIGIASRYFNQIPYLTNITLRYSFPTTGSEWEHSQLWHKDYNDSKELKFFIYCSDVRSSKNGPFSFLPKQFSERIPNSFLPRRISDSELRSTVEPDTIVEVLGPPGTVLLVDTAKCYHQGSRCIEPRLAFWLTFNSHAALYPSVNEIKIDTRLDSRSSLVVNRV